MQKSSLSVNTDPTKVKTVQDRKVLQLFHPEEPFALNLRAYISILLPSLKCSMGIQSSDGKGIVLKYAVTYVSKWQDTLQTDALSSVNIGQYEGAYRFLRSLRPLEPEMSMSLAQKKISGSKSTTKKITVPIADGIHGRSHEKYCARTREDENLSYLQWLRLYNDTPATPKLYSSGNTLGCKTRNPYGDDFYYQYLLMNKNHRNIHSTTPFLLI